MQLLRTASRLAQTCKALVSLTWYGCTRRRLEPSRLRTEFERLGATYIKLGQFIASTPSLFPPPFVTAFQDCLDQVAPVPFAVIQRQLVKELGRPPTECFAEIDAKPLASASIAQVHAARLPDGTQVVLKVQRPGVLSTLRADLFLIKLVIHAVHRFYPVVRRANLLSIAQDMESKFIEECNFLLEAERIGKFSDFLRSSQVKIVTVPRVYAELTTARLLVMDRLAGQPVSDTKGLKGLGPTATMSLQLALQVWLMSVTQCGFFHADVHGGNLLLLADGRVGMIDFGVVDSIAKQDWEAAVQCIQSLQNRDYRRVAAAMVSLGAAKGKVNEQQLALDLTQSFAKIWSAHSPADANRAVATALSDFCGIAEHHDLHFPFSFFLLLRQYLYFERYLQLAQ